MKDPQHLPDPEVFRRIDLAKDEDMRRRARRIYKKLTNWNCGGIDCNDCPFNNFGPKRKDIGEYCGLVILMETFEKVIKNAEYR